MRNNAFVKYLNALFLAFLYWLIFDRSNCVSKKKKITCLMIFNIILRLYLVKYSKKMFKQTDGRFFQKKGERD